MEKNKERNPSLESSLSFLTVCFFNVFLVQKRNTEGEKGQLKKPGQNNSWILYRRKGKENKRE